MSRTRPTAAWRTPVEVTGLLIVLIGCSGLGAREPAKPLVAAASDLQFAFAELNARFSAEHGEQVEVVFGSSGNLTRQILDGSPVELFLSADESFVEKLVAAGLTRDGGTLYGIGRIVLFAPNRSPLRVDSRLDGLAALVAKGGAIRFAIANPAHAPYGRAAEAALRKRGLWEALQPFLVLGENVSQAAQFATTGNVVGGILAHSLVLAAPMRDRGTYVLLPETDHPPLRQRMVLLKRAGPISERFCRFLQEPAARAILQRYGFALPPPSR